MKRALLIAAVCVSMAASASADLTTIYQTSWGPSSGYTEEDLAPMPLPERSGNPGGSEPVNGVDDYRPGDVLSRLYGTWTRIDDDFDQIWQDLDGGMRVTAKYTSVTAFTLVYSLNEITGGSPVDTTLNLLNESTTINVVPNSDLFIWGASGAGSLKWSNEALNGGQDWMVTFKIDTLNDGTSPLQPTYVIGFEDGSDWDFQDLVVEVTNVAPVPVPGAVLLGLLGLGAAGLKLRKHA
jgi:hypothetical protein